MSSPPLPTVAVDVDEVLGAFLAAFCAFVNEERASAPSAGAAAAAALAAIAPSDFTSYHFSGALGMSDAEASAAVQRFFASRHFLCELAPLAGARAVLLKHAGAFRFVVVTSRSMDIADATRAWLDEHFAGCFAAPPLFGCAYGQGVRRPKSELCREIGAVMLIDDQLAYAREAAASVERIVLFGRYAWNALSPEDEAALPWNVRRVGGWAEVDAVLTSLAAGPSAR
jgi:hypothetical protein